MKTLVSVIAFSFLSLGAFCQQGTSKTTTKKATPAAVAAYRCPMCTYSTNKAGDCPKDKVGLVKVGDYYCPDCYMTSTKAGKCSMCNVEMKKMEASTK